MCCQGSVLYLPAVADLLIKDTKLIADAVTVRRQAKCCHGIQETRCIEKL